MSCESVYLAESPALPARVTPPPSKKYWTRRGVAEWLVEGARSRHMLRVVNHQFLKVILQGGTKILAIGQHSRLTNISVIL